MAISKRIREMLSETLSGCEQSVRTGKDFKEIERDLMSGFMQAASQAIGNLLSQYDIDSPELIVGDREYHKTKSQEVDYFTCAGKIKIKRTQYKHPVYGTTVYPLNLRAGIVCDHWTPQAAKIATLATAEMTPYSAEKLFKEIGAMIPSKSSLDRLPKKINQRLDFHSQYLAEKIREHNPIPENATQLAVSLDGVHVAIQKLKGQRRFTTDRSFTKTRGQTIKVHEDYSRYREASCGTVSYLDKDGELLQTHYYSRMPEERKVKLKSLLEEHVKHALKERPDIKIIAIADGAKDNWTFIDETFPSATKILDFYHAAEHLKKAIDTIYSDPQKATEAFEKQRSILRHSPRGIDKIIDHLTRHYRSKPSDGLRCEINYFKSNRTRCNYFETANQCNPIGSGIVEAACKSLVSKRLKCSGMAWRWKGGQAILNFRSYLKSNLFDSLWVVLEEVYKQPVFVVGGKC